MGLKRWLYRKVLGGWTSDAIQNVFEERNLKQGILRTVKEDIAEDNPVTSAIYKMGKYDGTIDGYNDASKEYEIKLLKQADEFLNKEKDYLIERDNYESLLDECAAEIERLTNLAEKSEEDKAILGNLITKEAALRNLK